jgi:HEAT repeat protein
MTEPTVNPARKLFFGLFVFPLLIAVGMAVLLCSVVLLTNEEETPETLVAAVKTGSPSKRWQKAYELSNELNRNQNAIRSEAILKEVILILADPERYDAKTRGYMAIALGRSNDPAAREALIKALSDESADVKLYALWSLGTLGAADAAPQVKKFLSDENAELRKTAAYVTGSFGDKTAIPTLLPLLGDTVADVRWNAALSLARLGSDAGQPILMKMVDRQELTVHHGLSDKEIEAVMINAVKGLALVGKKESLQVLTDISKHEKSLKVRQAAIDAIRVARVTQ